MKKFLFVLLLVLLVSSPALFAQAQQDFTVVNKTGLAIANLFVSPAETNNWEEDVLGVDVLQNDEQVDIQFHPSEESCLWDIKIIDEEGDSVEWYKIDLCKALVVALYWENGEAWADVENVDE